MGGYDAPIIDRKGVYGTLTLDGNGAGGGPDDGAGAHGGHALGVPQQRSMNSDADSADAAAGWTSQREKYGDWGPQGLQGPQEWVWDDYIKQQGATVRVNLCRLGLVDHDLASMLAHLDAVLDMMRSLVGEWYSYAIDVSCNLGITDGGVVTHLVPFLRRWPACHRLKLYQTAVGDATLMALHEWIAGGHAHELHMSQLAGGLSREAVLDLLLTIHGSRKYPYASEHGGQAALWLRLERNGIEKPEMLVNTALSCGMSLRVLHKSELPHVRPGSLNDGRENPEVILVLFHEQTRVGSHRTSPSNNYSSSPCESISGSSYNNAVVLPQPPKQMPMFASSRAAGYSATQEEWRGDYGHGNMSSQRETAQGGLGAGRTTPAGPPGVDYAAGLTILEMLRKNSRVPSCPLSEPQPLSTDEFRLQEMERREDAERGDDVRNADTFGTDAVCSGWSFEENLAANERIAERERLAAAANERQRTLQMALAAAQHGYSGPGLHRNGQFSAGFEDDTISGIGHNFRHGPRPEVPRRSPPHAGLGSRLEPEAAQSLDPAPTQIPLPKWAAPPRGMRSPWIQDMHHDAFPYRHASAAGMDGPVPPMTAFQQPTLRTTLAPPWVQTTRQMDLPQADLKQVLALVTNLADKLAGSPSAGRALQNQPPVRRYGGFDLPDPSREGRPPQDSLSFDQLRL